MLRNAFLLLVAIGLAGCGSQALSWVGQQFYEEFDDSRDPFVVEYDESAIFPAPNERLACEMDALCDKPLSEQEFESLTDAEKLLAIHGDDG